MTPDILNGEASRLMMPLHFPDFAVSWAGPGRRVDEFCFGSEDGKLLFTTLDGKVILRLDPIVKNPEAVNGAAFIGDSMAISTRNEITFWESRTPGSKEFRTGVVPCGTHGIIATAEGYFVAALGPAGLLKVLLSRENKLSVTVSKSRGQAFNYYKAINLHSDGQREVIACAARLGGMLASGTLLADNERGQFSYLTSSGLDLVDICSLGSGATPPAVVGLGRDGTLMICRDVLRDRSPIAIRFADIPGVAYRVWSAQGTLILLTSYGLFILTDLARRFLAGEAVERTPTLVRGIPLEAVDANLCGERWLLVVMPDGALRFDLNLLLGTNPLPEPIEEAHPAYSTTLQPIWQYSQVASEQFAVAQ